MGLHDLLQGQLCVFCLAQAVTIKMCMGKRAFSVRIIVKLHLKSVKLLIALLLTTLMSD
jgi:hypothetical protein